MNPRIPTGIGVTFNTDADNSGPGPWLPEPSGVNTVTFGWSAGMSLTSSLMHAGIRQGGHFKTPSLFDGVLGVVGSHTPNHCDPGGGGRLSAAA